MNNYTYNDMLTAAKEQLALDLNCAAADFDTGEIILTDKTELPGRRRYSENQPSFAMTTFGKSAVISVDPRIKDEIAAAVGDESPLYLFDTEYYLKFDKILEKTGNTVSSSMIYFLPEPSFKQIKAVEGFTFEISRGAEIEKLYPEFDANMDNALLKSYQRAQGWRHDMIAVTAYDADGNMAGMSGCSDDGERLWQVGIDVYPQYRRRGLAAALVGIITDEILSDGAAPFYGTWSANIASMRVALSCGYHPAWNEVTSSKL